MTSLFIAGATGLVGRQALELALADVRVKRVIAPTRRSIAPHPKLANPRLDALIDDVGPEGWRADGAICALGTTRAIAGSAAAFRAIDHDLVLAIARRLRAAGVERFALVSSLGADPRSRVLYTRTNGEMEEAICGLGFPSFAVALSSAGARRKDAERLWYSEDYSARRMSGSLRHAEISDELFVQPSRSLRPRLGRASQRRRETIWNLRRWSSQALSAA